MNPALLCLGGNTVETSGNITRAISMLAQYGHIYANSGQYPSASGYLNEVVAFESAISAEALVAHAKRIELELGRLPHMKAQGIVPIDIDVVAYAGRVLRPQDYASAYFRTGLQKIAVSTDDLSKFFTNFAAIKI